MNPLDVLRKQFGYADFRLQQEPVIRSVLQGKDTFALMPTGGGKSLCYQIPALILDGLTIVVSPLIALMKDQVDALRLSGIAAAYLNSSQSAHEQELILEQVRSRTLKLLYLAPEKLLGNSMALMRTLETGGVSLIAVDEAHCISHWGHDFRPEYRMLSQLKPAFPHVPIIALTATADNLTRADIVAKLGLRDAGIFLSSFNRPNIRYTVQSKRQNSFGALLSFLAERQEDAGIIYCLSRRSTEALAGNLAEKGFAALPYHAGMEREARAKNQEMFLRDEVKIIVATIAFGMGIDKSNVRFVVHMDLPKNIESYYQETGRAGRDGLPSEALLFYGIGDVIKLKRFAQIENNPEQTDVMMRKLDKMRRYGELTTCRRQFLLRYFDEASHSPCGNCDVCLGLAAFREPEAQCRPLATPKENSAAPLVSGPPMERVLFQELRRLRRQLAAESKMEIYMVLSEVTLREVATYLPHAEDDLAAITGFGAIRRRKYGIQVLEIVRHYCAVRGLSGRMSQKVAVTHPDGTIESESATKLESLALFRQGHSPARIAQVRNLSLGTVEAHLAFYVGAGKLPVDDLLDRGRIDTIREAIRETGGRTLSTIRHHLGDGYSYGEIRYVIASTPPETLEEAMAEAW